MSSKKITLMSEKLNAMQLAVKNSLGNQEIRSLVAGFGFDEARLQEGMALYEAALNAFNAQEAESGAARDATQLYQQARAQAEDAYQALVKIARRIFAGDEPARTALELRGQMPRAIAPFLARAYRLFDNALKSPPEVQQKLASFGYTPEKLQTERERIAAYDRANQSQEAAKGTAQDTTQDQNRAISLMWDWYGQYRIVAKVALRNRKQLLEKLGISARTSRTPAQAAALRKRRKKAPQSAFS